MRWYVEKLSFAGALLLGLVLLSAQSPISGFPPGTFTGRAALDASSFTATCTPSTNFLARTSGLSNAASTNYDNLICGLETDSVGCVTGSEMKGLYVLAAPDATTSLLNLCSASFALVSHGTVTFSANNGYTGNGSTGYLDTGIAPNSGGVISLNSTSIGSYIVSSRTVASTAASIGGIDSGTNTFIQPLFTGNLIHSDVNGVVTLSTANTNAKGNWIVTRTSSVATALYLNSNTTPVASSGADTASGPAASTILILASNLNSSPTFFSVDQVAFAFIGAGLSAANMKKVADRINTFATALGINAY